MRLLFRPAVRMRIRPGNPLFSAVSARRFNRTLRAVFRQLDVPGCAHHITHGFRRGTSQDMEETGSPWEVVAMRGMRNASSFRGYVDRAADDKGVRNLIVKGVRDLFVGDSDSDPSQSSE